MHFFDFKFVEESKRWARWHIRSNVKRALKSPGASDAQIAYLKSLTEEPILNGTWYKRAFAPAPAGSVGFDATPEYCAVPEVGIEFIKKFLKGPFIIYIIRDPVQRALSQIRMNMYRKKSDFTDPEAWHNAARAPVVFARGDYRTFVPRWDRVFPNVLYVPFGELSAEPVGVLRRIENYCGLAEGNYPSADRPVFESIKTEVPSSVLEYLSESLEPQRRYVAERFGRDFAGKIL
jgi:hypothetical protein